MFSWFKKEDTLDLEVEISYYDSMNCLVLIDTPTIPVKFPKDLVTFGGKGTDSDVSEIIKNAIFIFAMNDTKIQSAFKDLRIPRKGFAHFQNEKFDMVKSNRKFWNHTVVGASGATTKWGKVFQKAINEKVQ